MSATVVESDTKQDLDLSVLEKLDFEVHCDWNLDEDCSEPAKWVLTTSCCGDKLLFCPSHKDLFLHIISDHFAIVVCARCKGASRPAIRYIFSAEPLDKTN